jgi:molybdenum cofactor synthesis domain-containing protein
VSEPHEEPRARLEPAARAAAVLTVSDRCVRGEAVDESGPHLVARLRQAGFEVGEAIVVPDEPAEVTRALLRLADEENMAVILTTGGTGLSPRDRTPEATRPLLEREAPGIAEAIRAAALQKTAHGMLSRGLAGTRGSTLIVNLPGSLKAVREGFEVLAAVLPHALDLLAGGQASPADHRAPPAATSTDESRHPGTPGAGLSP